MSIVEIKKELHNIIDESDDKSIQDLYQIAKKYLVQKKEDLLMAEAEEDIKAGRVYSIDESKRILQSWRES